MYIYLHVMQLKRFGVTLKGYTKPFKGVCISLFYNAIHQCTILLLQFLNKVTDTILFKFHRTETEKNLTADSSSTDVKSFFSNCNVAALRQLGGGRVLLDLCISLPEFSKIASKPAGPSPMMSLTSSR